MGGVNIPSDKNNSIPAGPNSVGGKGFFVLC